MNIPNILTLGRIVLVPLVIWLIITHEMLAAFLVFLLAGLTDAADGFLAKRYGWNTELGAYLDPIADKALLVSIYVTLGLADHLPVWLVIAVVSRDILIVGAVVLSWMLSRPLSMQPLPDQQSQHVRADRAGGPRARQSSASGSGSKPVISVLIWVTGTLTIVSAAAYFWGWLKHMASYEPAPQPLPPRQRKGARVTRARPSAGARFVTQLVFDLPHRAALGAEDFLVSGCNLAAVKLIDAWPGLARQCAAPDRSACERQDASRARVAGAVGRAVARPYRPRHRRDRCDGGGCAARGRRCRPPAL